MKDEHAEFSKRLAAAMRAMGYEARPSILYKRFNSRYRGESVSFQTASRWLNGKSLPEQERLVVLAELFRIDPQTLRYGGKDQAHKNAPPFMWPDQVTPRYQALFEDFLALPEKQREIVGNLIASLTELAHKQK
ncbi:MAG: helix-turn-helix domain-containing protein [Proteobacteria bacterium]|nr:helix-turn-helix domain-containing protein [Pseudomonadota bacterium]MCL2306945.1 helix-turn-helix domain-containing protein [Pseudomonadota bacterium]